MNKSLSKKVRARTKASAHLLLMGLLGRKCTLQFERQDEVFKGVLRSRFLSMNGEEWFCGASFKPHWLTAVEPNDDATYTICVRIPNDEYEDLMSMDCDEMLTYDEENEGRSPDCEDWR